METFMVRSRVTLDGKPIKKDDVIQMIFSHFRKNLQNTSNYCQTVSKFGFVAIATNYYQ